MEGSPLAGLRSIVQQTLNLPGDDALAVDYILSIFVSNIWSPDADPLWGWLVGPPGSCKTELLRGLRKHPKTFFLSTATPAAWNSGYDPDGSGNDPSLLPQMHKKVTIIKDFTAASGGDPNTFKQHLGILRDVYDGFSSKGFGTVGLREHVSKFGLIAAMTPALDDMAPDLVALGERFICFRICKHSSETLDSRIAYLKHVQRAMSNKAAWRKQLEEAWHSTVDTILGALPSVDGISISESQSNAIVFSADLLSRLRCLPSKDGATTPKPEIASRLVNQLTNLNMARAVADGRRELDGTDLDFMRRALRDTLPPDAWLLTRALYGNHNTKQEPKHIRTLSKRTHIPVKRLEPLLSHWKRFRVVNSSDSDARQGYVPPANALWKLSDDTLRQIDESGIMCPAGSAP